jgi:hypothetical protein
MEMEVVNGNVLRADLQAGLSALSLKPDDVHPQPPLQVEFPQYAAD